jgi:membrane-associated phospholipid phosphatase
MDILTAFIAQYLIYFVATAAIIITAVSGRDVRNKIIRLAIFSFIIAFILGLIAGSLYYNPRPFVVEPVQPLFPYQPNNGFPSEHTLVAMVIAGAIFAYRQKSGILLVILGILIGVSRVIANVHHPVDIIGGVAVAVVSTGIAWMILKRLERSAWWVSLLKYIRI